MLNSYEYCNTDKILMDFQKIEDLVVEYVQNFYRCKGQVSNSVLIKIKNKITVEVSLLYDQILNKYKKGNADKIDLINFSDNLEDVFTRAILRGKNIIHSSLFAKNLKKTPDINQEYLKDKLEKQIFVTLLPLQDDLSTLVNLVKIRCDEILISSHDSIKKMFEASYRLNQIGLNKVRNLKGRISDLEHDIQGYTSQIESQSIELEQFRIQVVNLNSQVQQLTQKIDEQTRTISGYFINYKRMQEQIGVLRQKDTDINGFVSRVSNQMRLNRQLLTGNTIAEKLKGIEALLTLLQENNRILGFLEKNQEIGKKMAPDFITLIAKHNTAMHNANRIIQGLEEKIQFQQVNGSLNAISSRKLLREYISEYFHFHLNNISNNTINISKEEDMYQKFKKLNSDFVKYNLDIKTESLGIISVIFQLYLKNTTISKDNLEIVKNSFLLFLDKVCNPLSNRAAINIYDSVNHM